MTDLLKNPLVLLVGGMVVGVLGKTLVGFLRSDAKKKRDDKNPGNDWQADLESALADALDKGDLGAAQAAFAKLKK